MDANNRIISLAVDSLKRQGYDMYNYQPDGDKVTEAIDNAIASDHADKNMLDMEHVWESVWYAMHYEA